MAITLTTLEENTTATATSVMHDLNVLKEAIEGISTAQTQSDLFQEGVVGETDWNFTANIVGATGKLGSTGSTGGAAWVPAAVSGLVRTFTTSATLSGLTPPTLPESGKFLVVGFELTQSGNAATVSLVSGAQITTEAEASLRESSPAISSGKIRIRDVLIKNNAGTYEIKQQYDRRRYATGAQYRTIAAEETRASVSLTNFVGGRDEVEVTAGASGLLLVGFHAGFKSSVSGAGTAAIFVGGNQAKNPTGTGTVSAVTSKETKWDTIAAAPAGLIKMEEGTEPEADAGTGQIIGQPFCPIFGLTSGTNYVISVRWAASSGNVLAKERKLWARAL